MKRGHLKGFATLEASALCVLFVLILIFGIALSAYVSTSNTISTILNRVLAKHKAAPFVFDQSVKIGSGVLPLMLNQVELSGLLDNLAQELESEIRTHDASTEYALVDPSRYFIEVGYSVVNLNPVTGEFQSFDNPSPPYLTDFRRRGTLSPLAGEADLAPYLEHAISQGQAQFPLASFGAHSSEQFFSKSVLVAARVVFEARGQGINYVVKQKLGESTHLAQAKVLALRGQIK